MLDTMHANLEKLLLEPDFAALWSEYSFLNIQFLKEIKELEA